METPTASVSVASRETRSHLKVQFVSPVAHRAVGAPKNGFRVDHAFANTAFQKRFLTISCRYDHGPREAGLTDHSALILKCS